MLTPEEMQKKVFALGKKLENNDVGMFVKELQINYQFLYNEVNEQKKQIKGMEAKLQHYRNIESSLQEAMISAEKNAKNKMKNSEDKAREIEKRAHQKADDIIFDAKGELESIKKDIERFKNDYINYINKYKDFIQGQINFVEEANNFVKDEQISYSDVNKISVLSNNSDVVISKIVKDKVDKDNNYVESVIEKKLIGTVEDITNEEFHFNEQVDADNEVTEENDNVNYNKTFEKVVENEEKTEDIYSEINTQKNKDNELEDNIEKQEYVQDSDRSQEYNETTDIVFDSFSSEKEESKDIKVQE